MQFSNLLSSDQDPEYPIDIELFETLIILQEECGEVIQSISKIFRFGFDPEKKEQLQKEIGDLQEMINQCVQRDLISESTLQRYAAEKNQKLQVYMKHFWSDEYESTTTKLKT